MFDFPGVGCIFDDPGRGPGRRRGAGMRRCTNVEHLESELSEKASRVRFSLKSSRWLPPRLLSGSITQTRPALVKQNDPGVPGQRRRDQIVFCDS